MKKLAALIITCVLLLQALPSYATKPPAYLSNLEYYNKAVMMDRIVVQFAPGTSYTAKVALLQQYGLTVLYAIPAPEVVYATLQKPVADYLELKKITANL